MTEQADSFKTNYATLQKIANDLRTQQEPDIDALIPMVDKATAAYKQCKNRIEAVKKALAERDTDYGHNQSQNTEYMPVEDKPPVIGDFDDDIPF